MGKLRAGAAWASVTPEEHYPMGGYHTSDNIVLALLRPKRSTGVHDAFEQAFPLADAWLVVAATLGAIGLRRMRDWGFLFTFSITWHLPPQRALPAPAK